MGAILPFILIIVLFAAATLVWDGCAYRFYRDATAGNGVNRNGRPKSLSLSQCLVPSRRKAERILSLSRSQRNKAALVRFVLGIVLIALMIVALILLSGHGLQV